MVWTENRLREMVRNDFPEYREAFETKRWHEGKEDEKYAKVQAEDIKILGLASH